MTQWKNAPIGIKAAPQTQDIQVLRDYVQTLADMLAITIKELNYIINGNLDVKNIRAKSITADRMDVQELSAITANLGHIIAGLIESVTIIGSEIMTRQQGQYPRTELSTTRNLLSAEQSAGYAINISPGGLQPNPFIEFLLAGAVRASMTLYSDPQLSITTSGSTNISIQAGNHVDISPVGLVRFDSWSKVYNFSNNQTLQQALNSLSNSISGLQGQINVLNNRVSALESGGSGPIVGPPWP
ncbi:hypothetical protein WMW72_10595 [Paenibacillus filicis]|uniref:Uncharacterized protein n=1 Tax=Paenibacillus filicis TaxID=669464 RepID=A0ABU9DHQ4_9BACL